MFTQSSSVDSLEDLLHQLPLASSEDCSQSKKYGFSLLANLVNRACSIFGPVDRGIAVAVFASATFIGPVAGPIVGGFITMSYL